MENDILDAFQDIGYNKINSEKLAQAVDGGPKSVEYTSLVEWLAKELQLLCSLDEHVNAITSPEDSSSFLLEVSSFLKELGCQYTKLMEGNVNQRLQTREDRLLLLDYLVSELQAAQMAHTNSPDPKNIMQVTIQESATAANLKNLLISLKFPKPPANITPEALFGKVANKVREITTKATPEQLGKPLFTGVLTDKQWNQVQDLQTEMHKEYRMRREMLLKRLDVTIQSFQWSDRAKSQKDRIVSAYTSKRNAMTVEPVIDLSDLLAAREDLAVLEKTSNASVRKNTQSSINKVMIGRVPDRGGRPSEQQAPPPEMPSWQQRPGGGGGGGGGRGGGGGVGRGGGDRGGRVQGGWNQGGDGGGFSGGGYQNRGGFSGSYQDQRGGKGYQDNRGGGYQDNRYGGYQQDSRGGGYQDNRGGGYQDRRGYQGGGGGGRGDRGGRGRRGYY